MLEEKESQKRMGMGVILRIAVLAQDLTERSRRVECDSALREGTAKADGLSSSFLLY